MSFSATEEFSNKKVKQWVVGSKLPNSAQYAIKLSINPYDGDPEYKDYFEQFLKLPDLDKISTLIIGCWGEAYDANSEEAVNLLVANKDKFKSLMALFIGDMALEEAEVSWIQQSNISPIYQAFPCLKYLKVRGGEGLSLGNLSHDRLRTLTIETGGLNKEVLEQARLANLELWLGDDNYGCDINSDDLKAFFAGLSEQFPKLSYLGLRNYHLTDELAAVVSEANLPSSLITLDLSLGVLTDKGAQALLSSDKLATLEKLDLHHHYLSTPVMKQLAESEVAQTIILDEQEEAEEYDGETYRYIFVSE